MELNKVEDYLRHAKIDLMTKSVFLSTICLSLKHSFTTDIPTAATNGLSIIYNPDFFANLTAPERAGLLAHEVWHVAFNHLSRVGERDKRSWNIAGDYVINLMLENSGHTIPNGGLLDKKYSNMSTEEVYELIKDDNEDSHGGSNFDIDLLDAPEGKKPSEIAGDITDIIIRAQLQSRIANKDKSEIPGEISRAIDELINPKLPWNQILIRFLSDMVKDDYTWARPNKRFFPQHYLPSQHSPTIGEIIVAIDTSGSVSVDELQEMLSEIESIRDTFKPEKLTIIDCDAKIHNIFKIEKYDNILDLQFKGNGGTDFQPVIDYCNEHEPEVLIYFTDLYADIVKDVGDYPVLWICTSNHQPAEIGETIYIN
jgi:predicted metal-dependent peptidase